MPRGFHVAIPLDERAAKVGTTFPVTPTGLRAHAAGGGKRAKKELKQLTDSRRKTVERAEQNGTEVEAARKQADREAHARGYEAAGHQKRAKK